MHVACYHGVVPGGKSPSNDDIIKDQQHCSMLAVFTVEMAIDKVMRESHTSKESQPCLDLTTECWVYCVKSLSIHVNRTA